MSKLLPNLPIEDLTSENDYLGIIVKGDLIKTFLQSNTQEFSEIKMFALYGEWGSGKSTLMKYLDKELKGKFNTFFFESWEFESDSNLAFSLLEFLVADSNTFSKKVGKALIEISEKLLEGFTKSIKLNGGFFRIDGDKLIEPFEKPKEKTFLQKKIDFKINFKKWEKEINKGKNPKYNIVFIDDLDRCEPENVLNLLSALKLFFTYGKNTIFFCGIDKKAVREAVNNKYGDIIKSDEYLEKIFDISFSIPKFSNSIKLFLHYFPTESIYSFQGAQMSISKILDRFFSSIRFSNPRKIKKVLNRFLILKNIEENLAKEHYLKKSFPRILENDSICVFDLIFTLYFIILKEFYPKKLDDIENDNLRSINYKEGIKKNVHIDGRLQEGVESGFQKYLNQNSRTSSFTSAKSDLMHNNSERGKIAKSNFIVSFAPIEVKSLHSASFVNIGSFQEHFNVTEKEIDYYFTYFLLANLDYLFIQEIESTTGINEMLHLIKTLP